MQWVCAVLFALFSFLFIYCFQGELLALMQDHLSDGMTKSNRLLAALIITALLMLLQWVVNRYSKLHGSWEALSYIPSCLFLALLTDVDDGTMLYSISQWLWGVPVCILLYCGVVWLNHAMIGEHKSSFFGMLWPNMLTFSLSFVLIAQISNHAPAPHMELAAWGYVHDGKYDEVLEVGKRSDDVNAELTALRNLAMAKTGKLGNRLFCYPQRYGADGLLYNRFSKQSSAYGAREYYSYLGGHMPYGGESGRAYAHRMAMKNDSAIYRDLYLAALLLDKDLDTFVRETASLASSAEQPVHYQEAWMLYNALHPDTPVPFVPDETLANGFAAYRALQDEAKGEESMGMNLTRRKYGNTYWHYYDYAGYNPYK